MPEYDDEPIDDDTEETGGTVTLNRRQIRGLEKKAAKAAELEEQLAQYQRAEMFTNAGFDLSDPMNQMFFRTYDGDLDEASIRASATELGWTFSDEGDDVGDDYPDTSGAEYSGGGSMKDDLEEAYSTATSQDDLNERIANIYRAHGETVSSDQ